MSNDPTIAELQRELTHTRETVKLLAGLLARFAGASDEERSWIDFSRLHQLPLEFVVQASLDGVPSDQWAALWEAQCPKP